MGEWPLSCSDYVHVHMCVHVCVGENDIKSAYVFIVHLYHSFILATELWHINTELLE